MKKTVTYLFILILPGLVCCGNEPFLTTPTDTSNHTPRTLEELQQVLDNDEVMNGTGQQSGTVPSLLVSGTDEITLSGLNQKYLTEQDIQQYTWGDDPFGSKACPDWDSPYRVILYANVVLDGLSKLTNQEQEQGKSIKGGALFFRAFMHYSLAQVFAPPYQPATATSDWGVPLRYSSDVNEEIKRATVQETYESILQDLHQAVSILPDTAAYKTRPSKAAALALLARVYQTMGQPAEALNAADHCLTIDDGLLDYRLFKTPSAGSFPFTGQNQEVLFLSLMSRSNLHAEVNPHFIANYQDTDLRKSLFFYALTKTSKGFCGSYGGSYYLFAGMATDEVYLIKAECQVRLGQSKEALLTLQQLLHNRYVAEALPSLNNPEDPAAVLQLVLDERPKELYGRGLRWTDLRRLNTEGRAIHLSHTYQGNVYQLEPSSPRYTWPIPAIELAFHPDMPQNTR
ncbi:SusD family protein [bacterium A37T11]|nr:SusD family protein [bacterium A37T11]